MRLTEKVLERTKRPTSGQQLLWDDLVVGFGCRLTPQRTSFVIQYKAPDGRKVRSTIHHWPAASVDAARSLARTELGRVAARDNLGAATPLHEAARAWFERCSTDWRPRYRQKVDRLLQVYLEGLPSTRVKLTPTAQAAIADLGSKPIGAVRRTDVLRVVDAISHGSAEQLMAILSVMLNWGAEREWIEHNPARNRLRLFGGRKLRHRALTDAELVKVWRAFAEEGDPHFGAFQVLVLTCTRRREVTQMEWSEVDLEAGTWTLPPERRKTGRKDPTPFVITLAPMAVEAIKRQPRLEGSPYVFWGRRDRRPFDFQNALVKRVRTAAGVADWRLHDIRRTARSAMGRLGVSQMVAEQCLSHTAKGGLVKVYDQHSYGDEKRAAWLKWAEHVAELVK